MDVLYWVTLVISLAATLAGGVIAGRGFVSSWRELRRSKRDPYGKFGLDERLAALRDTVTALRMLAADVTAEAEAQAVAAEVAAARAAENQHLASLSEEQAAAVATLLDKGAGARQRASTRTTIIWALIGIAASNLASVLITIYFSG